MITVDTNVVVRLLVEDDPEQTKISRAVFEENDVLLLETVMLEVVWVLERSYGQARAAVSTALTKLFGLAHVSLRDPESLQLVLEWYSMGLDFGDALHLALAGQITRFVTFDRRFAKRAEAISGRTVTLLGRD